MLVECRVPRLWGHYNRDIEHYRPKEDKEDAKRRDPIGHLSAGLLEDGTLNEADLGSLTSEVNREIEETFRRVLASPEPNPRQHESTFGCGTPNPATVERRRRDKNHELRPGSQRGSLDGVAHASRSSGLRRRRWFCGGNFRASKGLQLKYGENRVFDTPISESAILGSAIGAAISGMKPIVEIMWGDFLLVALDQIINQAANVRYITGGKSSVPMVIRTQQGVTPGSCAQHSQSLEALLSHIPGIRVAIPSTPQDAYDILRSAVNCPDPCIIFEARGLYASQGTVHVSDDVEPIGKARLARSGKDAVIVTWGTMMRTSLEAAETLRQGGVETAIWTSAGCVPSMSHPLKRLS